MKIAIAGAGKLGLKVTDALLGGDHAVTIIDTNETVIDKLTSQMDVMTVNADAKEISVLKQINIASFDYLLASTGSDELNILIAGFAKKLGCASVIAAIRDPENMAQVDFIKDTMGIDYIVNPNHAIALEIYKYLVEKYTLKGGIFTSGKVSLVEFGAWRIPKLKDMPIPEISSVLENMLVVAISRNGKVIVPHGDTVIQETDVLYVIGETQPISKLNAGFADKGEYTDIQKVMILGGGKTGLYLASKLEQFGLAVKIVEQDTKRCHYLSSHLNNTMILNGDATDMALLDEEDFNGMDALITATGFDEENLLMALTGKQRGIEDVIAKISHSSYTDLVETMGVDMALNPLDITASNIMRFIQGSKRVISSVIVQGQAELIEIIADEKMPIMKKPLASLTLPNGMIIAAIHRGSDVIIPKGDTVIEKGDKVTILILLSEIKNLEKLITTRSSGLFSKDA